MELIGVKQGQGRAGSEWRHCHSTFAVAFGDRRNATVLKRKKHDLPKRSDKERYDDRIDFDRLSLVPQIY